MLGPFNDIQTAATGVLASTCKALTAAGVCYVVVGGWVPFLRCKPDGVQHPGTNDVDILLGADDQEARLAVQSLIQDGFLPSAKHSFQLLKEIQVGTARLVFNVDLLRPVVEGRELELFSDIFDLGIQVAPSSLETRFIQSIVFLSAEIVFSEPLWSDYALRVLSKNGDNLTTIPLMDEVGLILSKCTSVKQIKRPRDAFDI